MYVCKGDFVRLEIALVFVLGILLGYELRRASDKPLRSANVVGYRKVSGL